MWKRLTIGQKISFGFLVLGLGLATVSIWACVVMNRISKVSRYNELQREMTQREVDHLNWAKNVSAVMTRSGVASIDVQTDPHKCGFGQWYYGEGRRTAETLCPEIAGDLKDIEHWHNELHASAVELNETLQQSAESERISQIYNEKTDAALTKVQQYLGGIRDKVAQKSLTGEETARLMSRSTLGLVVTAAACVAVGLTLSLLIVVGINRALSRISRALNAGAAEVAGASAQLASASESLASGASQQAAGLEETSSSLEEMSSMTRRNADNASQADSMAGEARQSARTGTEAMQRMIDAINQIQRSSDETARIIKVIDEIAFQTNLLALNAAVEAARAGEAGKGFAVVAEEVRNLAMRSAEAAKNTSIMIEDSVKQAGNGVTNSQDVQRALEDIADKVNRTTELVAEISAATKEQAQGIEQVNTAVSQMDKVTQQNAANAEESASASEELSAQAEQMKSLVSELMAMAGGHSGAGRGTPPAKGGGGSFGKSDSLFHSIANGKSGKARKAANLSLE